MLDLLDYRRRVGNLYREIREDDDPERAWNHWRTVRDDLFRTHPQSALDEDQKRAFRGLSYFDYDLHYRIIAEVDTDVEPHTYTVEVGADGRFTYRRFGKVRIDLPEGSGVLHIYWIEGYGGGVFLPFKDATSGHETYGAGRYLLDSIKGADLGSTDNVLILDFNFAYHPSCHYNPRWVCPLAPVENRLPVPVRAGERLFDQSG